MGDASIRAVLGLDTAEWKANAKDAAADATKIKAAATQTAAGIALLERQFRAAGGATAEQSKQLKEQHAVLSGLENAYKRAAREAKLLNEADAATGPKRVNIPGIDQTRRATGGPTPPLANLKLDKRGNVIRESEESSSEGGHGSNRGELAHSVRSIGDMISAGQSPLSALQMEAPRIAQSMGASVGTIIGISLAGVVANKLAEMVEDNRAVKERQQASLSGDPSKGIESVAETQAHVAELNASINEARPQLGMLGKLGQLVSDAATGFVGDLSQILDGKLNGVDVRPDDERKESLKKQVVARDKYVGRIVDDAKVTNDYDEEAFNKGDAEEKPKRIERQRQQALGSIEDDLGIPKVKAEIDRISQDPTIWDADKQKQLKQLQDELNLKVKEATGLQEQANRHFDLEAKKAAVAEETQKNQRQLQRQESLIAHPGIEGRDGVDHLLNVPANMTGNRSIARALAERDKAVNDEEAIHKRDGFTGDAHNAVLSADSSLRDKVIDEAMKTPEERAREVATQQQRDRVEQRLEDGGRTHDADRDGSLIHNANGPGGSMIPDAGTGHGAAASLDDANALPDNASIPDNAPSGSFDSFFAHPTIPASIFPAPNIDSPDAPDSASSFPQQAMQYLQTIAENCTFKGKGA